MALASMPMRSLIYALSFVHAPTNFRPCPIKWWQGNSTLAFFHLTQKSTMYWLHWMGELNKRVGKQSIQYDNLGCHTKIDRWRESTAKEWWCKVEITLGTQWQDWFFKIPFFVKGFLVINGLRKKENFILLLWMCRTRIWTYTSFEVFHNRFHIKFRNFQIVKRCSSRQSTTKTYNGKFLDITKVAKKSH